MNSEYAVHGQEARNALQLQLLEKRDMADALSGLKFLRALPYVDARDVAVIGHSFGGSLTVLLAEREPTLRAVVVFSGAGYSFDRSPELRARLFAAMDHIAARRSSSFTPRTITRSRPARCWTPAASGSVNRIA